MAIAKQLYSGKGNVALQKLIETTNRQMRPEIAHQTGIIRVPNVKYPILPIPTFVSSRCVVAYVTNSKRNDTISIQSLHINERICDKIEKMI